MAGNKLPQIPLHRVDCGKEGALQGLSSQTEMHAGSADRRTERQDDAESEADTTWLKSGRHRKMIPRYFCTVSRGNEEGSMLWVAFRIKCAN